MEDQTQTSFHHILHSVCARSGNDIMMYQYSHLWTHFAFQLKTVKNIKILQEIR